MDGIQGIESSLNPNLNLTQIYNNVQANGGKSGQFFFFSADSTLIMKTMSETELHVLLDRTKEYYRYF